jgi:cytochrome c oxidase cbb3-type subunit 3
MADFDSSFWSVYITLLTVASIAACAVLLWVTSKKRGAGDSAPTTGHVWDETLSELNTPLPRWWMWLFYLTIGFGVLYLVLYPGLGSYGGAKRWTSIGQYQEEVRKADAQFGPTFQRFAALPIEAVAADPQAHAIGERLFLNYCSQCHGSDARGAKGFPDLTDNDWLYGGTPADIEASIANGRHGVMPALAEAIGSEQDVRNLAEYVLSLSGSPHDSLAAQLGKDKFVVCAACHGAEGKGNTVLGVPNLTDHIWLYGGGVQNIIAAISKGHDNTMPAHKNLLGAAKVHVLAAYVWSLSNRGAPIAQAQGVAR